MEKWVQTNDLKVKQGDVELNIGDYIDYHDCAGENGKDLYEGRWQVLGADDMGNLLIVSENNVTTYAFNKELTLENAKKAYSKGVETLDKICEVYAKGNGAISARSIRIEDVDKVTGYDKTTDSEYGKKYTYKNKKGDCFIWHDGINWRCTKSEKNITLTQNYYSYKADLKNRIKIYKMLFEKQYWLGSTYVNIYSHFACFGMRYVYYNNIFGYGFVYTYGDVNDNKLGVRPVVILKTQTY